MSSRGLKRKEPPGVGSSESDMMDYLSALLQQEEEEAEEDGDEDEMVTVDLMRPPPAKRVKTSESKQEEGGEEEGGEESSNAKHTLVSLTPTEKKLMGYRQHPGGNAEEEEMASGQLTLEDLIMGRGEIDDATTVIASPKPVNDNDDDETDFLSQLMHVDGDIDNEEKEVDLPQRPSRPPLLNISTTPLANISFSDIATTSTNHFRMTQASAEFGGGGGSNVFSLLNAHISSLYKPSIFLEDPSYLASIDKAAHALYGEDLKKRQQREKRAKSAQLKSVNRLRDITSSESMLLYLKGTNVSYTQPANMEVEVEETTMEEIRQMNDYIMHKVNEIDDAKYEPDLLVKELQAEFRKLFITPASSSSSSSLPKYPSVWKDNNNYNNTESTDSKAKYNYEPNVSSLASASTTDRTPLASQQSKIKMSALYNLMLQQEAEHIKANRECYSTRTKKRLILDPARHPDVELISRQYFSQYLLSPLRINEPTCSNNFKCKCITLANRLGAIRMDERLSHGAMSGITPLTVNYPHGSMNMDPMKATSNVVRNNYINTPTHGFIGKQFMTPTEREQYEHTNVIPPPGPCIVCHLFHVNEEYFALTTRPERYVGPPINRFRVIVDEEGEFTKDACLPLLNSGSISNIFGYVPMVVDNMFIYSSFRLDGSDAQLPCLVIDANMDF
jgi:hypothetical protein